MKATPIESSAAATSFGAAGSLEIPVASEGFSSDYLADGCHRCLYGNPAHHRFSRAECATDLVRSSNSVSAKLGLGLSVPVRAQPDRAIADAISRRLAPVRARHRFPLRFRDGLFCVAAGGRAEAGEHAGTLVVRASDYRRPHL